MALASAIIAATALGIAAGLRDRVGMGRAAALGLGGAMLGASIVGLVLLDAQRLQRIPLLAGLSLVALIWAVVVWRLRRRWPPRIPPPSADTRHLRWGGAGLLLIVTGGTALRLDPSPYLHGGQDQGIYVNVGHNIARTGRLRPVDPLLAGRVPGIPGSLMAKAHRIGPIPDDSPLSGVREGRWIAGLHIEDAQTGRLMPGFFHLLPTWFAMAELDLGFARSTWALIPFAWLSLLAAFAVGYRVGTRNESDVRAERRGWAVGLLASTAMALHPLDLWISTFTVTENLARACLLGSAALGLEAIAAERDQQPGARTLAACAGLVFAAGAFARGSMLALAMVLAASLVLARPVAPRSRRALLFALVTGTTLAATQAILHSWPYFFSAASNHFHVPRIRPFQSEAVAWAMAAGVAVLLVDFGVGRIRRAWPRLGNTDRLLRTVASAALLAGVVAIVVRALDQSDAYGPHQQVLDVLRRHGGDVALVLGAGGLWAWARRSDAAQQPWVLLAAAIIVLTTLKEGIRYEQYYARYLVGDAIPVLVVAGAWAAVGSMGWVAARLGPRPAAAALGVLMLAWWLPPLRVLSRPIYWTRDLSHAAEDLTDLFSQVPDDAVMFFDARAPGRWRGILATPALLSFGRPVFVYPSNRLVERAVTAGTPVYMLSGGWETEDRQRWPNNGPWRTRVVARGFYRARRAEIVEGGMPQQLVQWGGPWELHRIDRSLWRGHGAFSLYRGSEFITEPRPGTLRTDPLPLQWQPNARVELHGPEGQWEGCQLATSVMGTTAQRLDPLPVASPGVRLFAMPPPQAQPITAAIEVTTHCPDDRALTWTRLSMRWERPRTPPDVP
ncbi:MAG: hypothetical protein K0V04_22505 [Deltaproteobacteria bacterium]|nr:hypothetical protein [Deltaproteobacteria bacterium]